MKSLENTALENTLKLKNTGLDIYLGGGNYINQLRLYHAYFEEIPNVKSIDEVDILKMRKWMLKEYDDTIQIQHFNQEYCVEKKNYEYSDHFLILTNGIVLNIYLETAYILYPPKLEESANEILEKLIAFVKKPKRTKEISFIVSSPTGGFTTKEIEVKKPKIDFDMHYNSDFKEIHETMIKNIKKKGTKGLYLFHGLPGTGKSTYIKYLINSQNKKVIFLSPKMASNLDDVYLTDFLLDNPNCILVIEDAEEIIMSRDNHQNTRLSFLLNLTDGLLSESLGIQVIATFNTDLKNIDKALLRKGRLTSIYEFKALELSKTNYLLQKLGHGIQSTQEMVLADIFNIEKENNYKPVIKNVVGFGN
jgi:hypothetical protein